MNNYCVKKRNSGAAMIELALILVPIILVLFATVEVGRALHHQNQLSEAVVAAGRYMARGFGVADSNCNKDLAEWAAVEARARNILVYGDATTSSGDGIIPGINAGPPTVALNIDLKSTTPDAFGECVITASASLPYSTVLGLFENTGTNGILPNFLLQLNAATEERYIGE